MSHRGWVARHHRVPGVSPLEVWNLPVWGRELWELLGTRRVDAVRYVGVPEAELASRLMPVLAEALDILVPRHAVDAVWLSGGLACLENFEQLLAEVWFPRPVYVARDPRFAPARAGLRLLESVRPANPVALDVGQTSVKCVSPGAMRVLERDTTSLPLRLIGTPRPADGHHIPAAIRFISGALRTFVDQDVGALPDALCLALPCPLDDALVPGGCTYGWEGHTSLVTDLLDAAALPGPGNGTVLVLNDAELAAAAAREDARLADSRRVLCLTLGFGPGGALLERG